MSRATAAGAWYRCHGVEKCSSVRKAAKEDHLFASCVGDGERCSLLGEPPLGAVASSFKVSSVGEARNMRATALVRHCRDAQRADGRRSGPLPPAQVVKHVHRARAMVVPLTPQKSTG